MGVEKHRLADRMGPDKTSVECGLPPLLEIGLRLVVATHRLHLRVLRARLQAAATAHALRQRVGIFLLLRRDPRAGAKVVGAFHGHPRLHFFKPTEQPPSIHHEVADHRKLRHRPQFDLVAALGLQPIDERRAGHPRAAVDQHRTGATDLFEAVAVPGDGSHLPAIL